jgi:hypothetical protein
LLMYNNASFMAHTSLSPIRSFLSFSLKTFILLYNFLKATPCYLYVTFIHWNDSYLWEEWKVRQKDTSEDMSSKFLNLRFVPLEVFA